MRLYSLFRCCRNSGNHLRVKTFCELPKVQISVNKALANCQKRPFVGVAVRIFTVKQPSQIASKLGNSYKFYRQNIPAIWYTPFQETTLTFGLPITMQLKEKVAYYKSNWKDCNHTVTKLPRIIHFTEQVSNQLETSYGTTQTLHLNKPT